MVGNELCLICEDRAEYTILYYCKVGGVLLYEANDDHRDKSPGNVEIVPMSHSRSQAEEFLWTPWKRAGDSRGFTTIYTVNEQS